MTPSTEDISLLDIHEEVEVSPTGAECSMNDTDIQAMYPGQYDFNSFYIKTADPGREDWGSGTYSVTANGLAYDPGTSDWTQAVVSVHHYGDFSTNTKVDGVSSTTTYIWSPLGAGGSNLETNGDYRVKWTLVSGEAASMGPGWAADGVWANLDNSGGFYFSQTDTASNGVARVSTLDVTISSRGTNQSALDATQRFTLTCDYDDGESITWTTTAASSSTFGLGGSNAELCGHKMFNGGDSDITNSSGTYVAGEDWLSTAPSGTGSSYEMKWVKVSGITPGTTYGTENTWLDLGTSRTMQYPAASTTRSIVYDLTVREDSNASSEVTKRITLSQEWEP